MKGVSAFLDRRNVNGTTVYGMRGSQWNLVKRNAQNGNFEPVDKLDRNLSAQDLDANYGIWVDKTVTKGHLWWKHVVRPQDGKVQPDEVVDFATFRKQQMSHVFHRSIGGDDLYTFDAAQVTLHPLDSGTSATLDTQWSLYHGDWNRYWDYVSPLAPPYANGA